MMYSKLGQLPLFSYLANRFDSTKNFGEDQLWWRLPDSNWGHKALQASALPTELKRHVLQRCSAACRKASCPRGNDVHFGALQPSVLPTECRSVPGDAGIRSSDWPSQQN